MTNTSRSAIPSRIRASLVRVIAVAVGVVVATFLLLRLVPGDPARAVLGDRATDASVAALHAQMGLDRPVTVQFWNFVGQIVLHGDTGNSLIYHVSTRELIVARAGASLTIVLVAALLAVVIAVPLALLASTHKDRLADHLVRAVPAIGMAMPVFWTGLLLVMVFAIHLRWFPVGGMQQGLQSAVLPGLAVAIGIVPALVRSLRAQLLEVLGADFVVTERAAGIPRWRILIVHVLRNAALPTISLFGLNLAYLLGGTLVVERVFDIDGVGSLMFEAIGNRDFPVVQGVALYSAALVVIVGIVTDVVIRRLDPRLRGV